MNRCTRKFSNVNIANGIHTREFIETISKLPKTVQHKILLCILHDMNLMDKHVNTVGYFIKKPTKRDKC